MWQRFKEQHQSLPFEMVAVAMDAQGASVARPYVQKAGVTFPSLVDQQNLLGDLFGFKAIPNLIKIDEHGIYCGLAKGEDDAARWIAEPSQPPARMDAENRPPSLEELGALAAAHPENASIQLRLGEALMRDARFADAERAFAAAVRLLPDSAPARFRLGGAMDAQGRKADAVRVWRKALALDPQNWLIHKQIWAVEHPERFYNGPVDYDWQKAQR